MVSRLPVLSVLRGGEAPMTKPKRRPGLRLDVHVTLDEDQLAYILGAFEHLADSIKQGKVEL